MRKVSVKNDKLGEWGHDKRRVGKPRTNWTEKHPKEIWNVVKRNHEIYRYEAFDDNNENTIELVKHFEVNNETYVPPAP